MTTPWIANAVIGLDGEAPRRIECAGGAAYELGMRETDHGIDLQPYPDG